MVDRAAAEEYRGQERPLRKDQRHADRELLPEELWLIDIIQENEIMSIPNGFINPTEIYIQICSYKVDA